MISFHGKPELKAYFVKNAIWHREADKYVQGQGEYDHNLKGCMIACSFKRYNHKSGSGESGFPVWLLKLADCIFEGLSKEESDLWTERFWNAAPIGVNLEQVKAPFLIFVLEGVLETFDHEKYPDAKKVVCDVIDLYKSGETDQIKYMNVARAARAAARKIPIQNLRIS